MPSTPYDLVKDQDQDAVDPKNPYDEQAFFRGITFRAKFIGWQEVPRPSSRTEIVSAMRRIRYECKLQNIKKRKVDIQVSVDGVKVCLKKKKRKKKQWDAGDLGNVELLNHPIYRIFYVSHDSNDLKIFSYIARDGSTDTFKCSVFKSNRKSQAMKIVKTVGQAFEVCHKISLQKNPPIDNGDDCSETACDTSEQDRFSEVISQGDDDDDFENIPRKDHSLTPEPHPNIVRPNHLDLLSQPLNNSNNNSHNIKLRKMSSDKNDKTPPLNANKLRGDDGATENSNLLRKQLEQQTLQTRQALAQLMLVREQLISETNARVEAQARTQQLLQQNRELLEHIAALGGYHDPDRPNLTAATIGIAPQLSSTAKVARWFAQLQNWNQTNVTLSRPESGFVSGDSRSEVKVNADEADSAKEQEFCDEYLLVEGTANLWAKLSAKKRKKLMGLRFGKVTTF